MNKIKAIFFLLQLIIFNFQFTTSFAQVISNNGAVLSVGASTTVSNIGSVTNTTGAIENGGTLNISSDVTNNATISGNGTYNVAGNFTNNSIFTPGTSIVNLNGSALQTIGGSTPTTFKNLDINNSSGISLGINSNISGILNFTLGVINTNAFKVSITNTGSITGAGTSRFVNGFLEKNIPMGLGISRTYEVGFGNTDYLPINLTFANVSVAGNFTGSANNLDHTDIANVCIDPSKSVNRNWSITNTGTTYTNYSATANFSAADRDGGSAPADYFMAIRNSGAWTILTRGGVTATSNEATGITTDGDLQIGEKLFVGTPVFTLGASSERCRAAAIEAYSATAVNSTSIVYTLDAASLSAGNTINAATGDVTYTAIYVGTSTITATAIGCFGPKVATHQASTTLLPVNATTISGIGCVAIGATQTYSITPVFRATTYAWTVPVGSTILSGQGTNIISVNFTAGLVNGFVTVTPQNACGSAAATTKKEVASGGVPVKPGFVFGPMVACSYIGVGVATYSITAVVGATSYLWSKPTGATITGGQGTTSITVTYTSAYSSGQFYVASVNGCGSSAFDYFTVTKLPPTPLSISGWANARGVNDNVTPVTYTTPVVEGVSSYNWTIPANVTISSGQGTSTLVVTYAPAFTSGNIGVSAVTACGSSAIKTKAIVNNTTTPLSASTNTISKKNVTCFGLNDGEASITIEGGSPPYTFVWNTSPIQTLATANSLAPGIYTVKAIDKFGYSFIEEVEISQPVELKVNAMRINNSLYGSNTGYAIAGASGGTGIYSYSWNTDPTQNSQELKDLEAGNYTVTVKDENNCSSYSTVVISDSLVDESAAVSYKVYPVPAVNQFTIEYSTNGNTANSISVNAYDGKIVFESSVSQKVSSQKIVVDCTSWSRSMYFVTIRDKDNNILSSKPIVLVQQ